MPAIMHFLSVSFRLYNISSGYNFGEFKIPNVFFGENNSIKTNNFVMFGALGLSVRVGKHMGLQAQYNLPLIVYTKIIGMIRGNCFRLSLYLK